LEVIKLCVAVPLQIKEIKGKRAVLESLGVITEADISLIADPKPGEYVLIHAGIAISKLETTEAEATLALFRELAEAEANG
jgi:hydrogenase expression/formation protein HypC